MNEQTQLIQLGLRQSLLERLQGEANRRGLPLRTMIRSILVERMNEQAPVPHHQDFLRPKTGGDAATHPRNMVGPQSVVPPPDGPRDAS